MRFLKTLFVAILVIVITFSSLNLQWFPPIEGKIKVVTTFYPLAYLAEAIGGEKIIVRSLMPYNVDPHHWQPSPSDILEIEKADIIVFNGAGLDDWIKSEILSLINLSSKLIVDTTEGLQLIELNEENCSHHNEKHRTDPHTWLSPYMALKQSEKILLALMEKDPNNKNYYQDRFENLKERLEALDGRYQRELSNKTKDIIVVTHEAFGYLAKRYGFKQMGIIGITAEEEPSISVIKNILEIIKEHDIRIIYIDAMYPKSYADIIKRELRDIEIVKLYLGLGPLDGKDYLQQLEENLNALKMGLR